MADSINILLNSSFRKRGIQVQDKVIYLFISYFAQVCPSDRTYHVGKTMYKQTTQILQSIVAHTCFRVHFGLL